MARGLHADLVTELATDHLDQIDLIQFTIGSTIYYRTSAYYDITYDGNTYIADGVLLKLPSISEQQQIATSNVTFTIEGASQTFISLLLNNEHIHRPVKIIRGYLTDAGALVSNPYTIFLGYISSYSINETTTSSTISISVANHWANFEMKRGRRTNDNSQQQVFNGDKFFEFSNALMVDIEWGKVNDEQ
jgi:hypothetical protein